MNFKGKIGAPLTLLKENKKSYEDKQKDIQSLEKLQKQYRKNPSEQLERKLSRLIKKIFPLN